MSSESTPLASPVRGMRPGMAAKLVLGWSVGVYPVLAVLVLWEVIAQAGEVSPLILPPFTEVAGRFYDMLVSGELLEALWTTTRRAAIGLVIGASVGVAVGLAMARIRAVEWLMDPIVAVGFPTPTITLLPVFVIWFGTGDTSKLLLVALTCFFPVVTSTYAGARQIDPRLIWSARAMGTSKRVLFRTVVFPASLPFMFSGIRVAVPLAVIVEFVAEMVSGGGGLGYTLIFGYRFLDTDTVFSALIAVLVFGMLLDRLVMLVRGRLLRWADTA